MWNESCPPAGGSTRLYCIWVRTNQETLEKSLKTSFRCYLLLFHMNFIFGRETFDFTGHLIKLWKFSKSDGRKNVCCSCRSVLLKMYPLIKSSSSRCKHHLHQVTWCRQFTRGLWVIYQTFCWQRSVSECICFGGTVEFWFVTRLLLKPKSKLLIEFKCFASILNDKPGCRYFTIVWKEGGSICVMTWKGIALPQNHYTSAIFKTWKSSSPNELDKSIPIFYVSILQNGIHTI